VSFTNFLGLEAGDKVPDENPIFSNQSVS